MESLLVVGSGLAGLSAVRAARELGFDGAVTVLGDEPHRPYDRPPLSKDYLAGTTSRAELDLQADGEDLGVSWVHTRARHLDAAAGWVEDDEGVRHPADGVVLATGSSARTFPELGGSGAGNVLTLRTVDDADRLRALLAPGAQVVVVGAGLIGSEVASTAAARGCRVTVLDRESQPLARLYGSVLAPRLAALADRSGVTLRPAAKISELAVVDGRVCSITLADGPTLPVDVVLVAVGGEPVIGWLADSGLDLADGVVCDASGRVLSGGDPVPGLVAVGDCAAWWDHHLQRHHRAQHWTDALERPGRAVATLLGVAPPRRKPYLPFFWSDQHGVQIQMAGYASLADAVELEVDDPATGQLLAVYRRGDEPVAVLAVSRPREFLRWRKTLVATLGHVPDLATAESVVAAPAATAPRPAPRPAAPQPTQEQR